MAVSLDVDVSEYVAREKLDIAVYIEPAPEGMEAYGLRGTPLTLLVSADGILEQRWSGAYVGRTKEDVENWVGLELPGLQPEEH